MLIGLCLMNILTFSGCAKEVSCSKPETHAHYYLDEETGLGRYIPSEKDIVNGLDRTEETKNITKDEEEYLKVINKYELYKIEDNQESIEKRKEEVSDHLEYEHQTIGWGYNVALGRYGETIKSEWDEDDTKDYSDERICHYVFYGYRIDKSETGKYKVTRSAPVDDISDLPEGYDYVKKGFVDVKYIYDKEKVAEFKEAKQAKTR